MKLLYILSSILIFSISSSFGQTSPDLSKLSKKQVEIMDSLNAYIDIIINKEAPYEVVMPARNKAESLFNPEALIEVSIPGQSEIRKFRSGKYLARIQLLKYEEVNITAIEFDKKDKIISANVVQVTKPQAIKIGFFLYPGQTNTEIAWVVADTLPEEIAWKLYKTFTSNSCFNFISGVSFTKLLEGSQLKLWLCSLLLFSALKLQLESLKKPSIQIDGFLRLDLIYLQ